VFAAAMTTTLIHHPPIHWKWVTPQIVDAEQQGEILHPSRRIHPRNGCLREYGGHSDVLQMATEAFNAAAGPSDRVATQHHFSCDALQIYGTNVRGCSTCGSYACPGISSGRSIEQLQVGNVAAENFCTFLELEPVARRIMLQRRI
jgi:hypothetical protein